MMPSAFSEEPLCGEFSPKCVFLPFHAASWVRGGLYAPAQQTKAIDLLMVANFSRHKRHWKLFEALATLPPRISAVLAGVPLGGRTRESLIREASLFGVADRVSIVESATDEELRTLLASAKLFCAMTHKEGSYIAVAEALMAGTPVAMFENAQIGTKVYVTDATGFLLSSREPLGAQLSRALERAGSLRPQEWAKSRLSAEVNSQRLNGLLRDWTQRNSLAWTLDIEPFFCKHFDFRYFRNEAESTLAAEYARIRSEFGLTVIRN
jgi:glycosyltransferase involved in cell wall biosynthesis